MEIISRNDCIKWCLARRINILAPNHSFFDGQKNFLVSAKLPTNFLDCVGMSITLDELLVKKKSAALLWFQDWDIWSPEIEFVGMQIWKKFRTMSNSNSLIEYPGHILTPNANAESNILILLPILFQWDVKLISDCGNIVLDIKHNGFIYLSSRNNEASISDLKKAIQQQVDSTPQT